MLPLWFFVGVAGVFGLIIGSFLNVFIYRFHTGRSLNDRSHCLSCGEVLHWYELFPVFSYLALRGRCRSCHSLIPSRYALVELTTALAFMLAYLHSDNWLDLALILLLVSTLIVGLVYDLYHQIIPDEVSLLVAITALSLVSAESFTSADWTVLLPAISAGAIAFLVYGSLWYFSQGRAFGFGDAKLAVGLGVLVGITGIFSFVVLSFWVGALVAVFLMLVRFLALHNRWRFPSLPRVKMKSEIPFAPFLIAAFVLVYFFDISVLEWVEALYTYVSF